MKTVRMCVALLMSVTFGLHAGESRSPEQMGAHRARVSDVAEIQLILDGLRANGGGSGVSVRKHLPPFFSSSRVMEALFEKRARGAASPNAQAPSHVDAGTDRYQVTVRDNSATVRFASGERLVLEKTDGKWKISGGSLPSAHITQQTPPEVRRSMDGSARVSVGETFVPVAVSREHSIGRLTERVTRSRLNRSLFGLAGKSASYIGVRYTRSSPPVVATYIQLVIDPEWDRILYGNMDKWIKAYPVQGPSAIAADADGNVFVGQPAHKRVLVLKLAGTGDNVTLQHRHQIYTITNPSDLALNDNGTPLNTQDDVLYVADATDNKIYKYTAGSLRNSLVAVFDGFSTPTAIAAGRWNGANTPLLYVVDKLARRMRVYADEGTSLSLIREFTGDFTQSFSSIKTDHFGNVYAVDQVHAQLLKFTPLLELLDADGGNGTYAGLSAIDIPFAKITVDGEGSYYAGFDQVFAVERWGDESGAQRRKLGVKMKDIEMYADADVSNVGCSFVLTDVAEITARIYDEQNRLVRALTSSWMNAGEKDVLWDRRSDDGSQVPAGTYRCEMGASSAYGGEPVFSNMRFYLPLYYHEDCGSADRTDDAHLVQGSAVRWGPSPSETANEHASSVQYRFTGLNPSSTYEVAAEFAAGDGVPRVQELTANGQRLGEPFRVNATPRRTNFIPLPEESYANGDVTIAVNRLGEGSAVVTQLWIKEVGAGLNPQPVAAMPTKYMLEQNYPNPFNPSTTIRYAIPADGHVTLKVYNIAGQEVATLVNEYKTAGRYDVVFEAGNAAGVPLASGIYFYRITVGGFTETRKMVVLR